MVFLFWNMCITPACISTVRCLVLQTVVTVCSYFSYRSVATGTHSVIKCVFACRRCQFFPAGCSIYPPMSHYTDVLVTSTLTPGWQKLVGCTWQWTSKRHRRTSDTEKDLSFFFQVWNAGTQSGPQVACGPVGVACSQEVHPHWKSLAFSLWYLFTSKQSSLTRGGHQATYKKENHRTPSIPWKRPPGPFATAEPARL